MISASLKATHRRLVCLVLVLCLVGCAEQGREEALFSGSVMGTSYSVKIVTDQPFQSNTIEKLDSGISQRLNKIDNLMSTYKKESEVSRFNRLTPGQRMNISAETHEVLSRSIQLYGLTSGSFDITVSPLVGLWGFGASSEDGFNQDVPDESELVEAKSLLGIEKVRLSKLQQEVSKSAPVQIDLSAIAKGYAVDQVAEFLDQLLVKNYLVEVGGEIRVNGSNKEGRSWSLGVELPDTIARKAHSIVSVNSGALATSGDYRNYFEQDGIRYSHVIDPVSMAPVKHKLASVSVLSSNCADADALATALLVMGEESGLQFAQENKLDAMFIYRGKEGFDVSYSGRFSEFLVR